MFLYSLMDKLGTIEVVLTEVLNNIVEMEVRVDEAIQERSME